MKNRSRLIVAANRLPVRRIGKTWASSSGGLVTALKPILQKTGGTWVGWTGAKGTVPRFFDVDGVRIEPVKITRRDVERYYDGMSNRTLWPLYHDAICSPEFHRQWWQPYCLVNERFARKISRIARPGDVVWIQDFHLQMAPAMLRTMRPDLRIGFFLHIPFPPDELFEWLPWRKELLTGLLGADVIGFQTANAVHNFTRAAREHTPAKGRDGNLSYSGRSVKVASFPISIDFQWWSRQSATPEARNRAAEIRQRLGAKRKFLLAVDRLDYTKGIVERLNAYAELLSSRKLSVNDSVLLQIAVPSRETVGDYAALRDTVERLVGRINGEFGLPGRVAVHYLRRNHSREEVAAYYRAADVMLVTPLRDGMNLVSKEYVACRNELDGVLVLSQFAGAANELTDALIVNPRDLDQTAASIYRALHMDPAEMRRRMTKLRGVVRKNDVFRWADRFLSKLRR